MASRISLDFVLRLVNAKAMKDLRKSMNMVSKEAKRVGKDFNKLRKGSKILKDISRSASQLTGRMNKLLGGRKVQGFAQSLTSVGNRLGFMAFQWNFMANAARMALDTVVGGMKRVIITGSLMTDSVVRALAFSTSASGILNMTESARKDIERMRDLIQSLSSGQTIFGPDVVSNIAGQFQKAIDDLEATEVILPFALKFKTIDPSIDDEKLATGLVTLFNAMGANVRNAQDIERSMDFIANLADKTTGNFQSSIASFARATPLAKAVGFAATETALALQIGFDILAANKSAGRSGQRAGRIFGSFIGELQELGVKGSKTRAFFDINEIFAFSKEGELLGLIDIIGQFRKKLTGLDDEAKAGFLEKAGFTKNATLFILGAITKTNKELEKMREGFRERGVLAARSAIIESSGQSQILKLQAALKSVQRHIADGFAPALREVAGVLSAIAQDRDFQRFLAEMGMLIGNELIPNIKLIAKEFKNFFKILGKEKNTMKFLAQTAVVFSAALAGLSIISSIGFFALVAAGSLFALTGQMFTAATAVTIFGRAMMFAVRWMLPALLALLGISLIGEQVAKLLEGKDGVNFGFIGLGAALATLGLAPIVLQFAALKKAMGGANVAAGGLLANLGKISKGTFGKAPVGGVTPIPAAPLLKQIRGVLTIGNLRTVGIFALAAVAGFAIGTAIANGMARANMEAARLGFKSGFDLILRDWKVTLLQMMKDGLILPPFFGELIEDARTAMNAELFKMSQDWMLFWEDFNKDPEAAFKSFQEVLRKTVRAILPHLGLLFDIISGNITPQMVGQKIRDFLDIFDADKQLTKQISGDIRQFFENIKEQQGQPGAAQIFTGTGIGAEQFPEIRKFLEDARGNVSIEDANRIMQEVFGDDLVDTMQQFKDGLTDYKEIAITTGTLIAESGISAKLVAESEIRRALGIEELNKEIENNKNAVKAAIEAENKTVKELEAMQKEIIIQESELEILSETERVTTAKTQNLTKSVVASRISMDAMTDNLNVSSIGFAELRDSLTRLAGFFDSITIDKKGRFHSSRPQSTPADLANIALAKENRQSIQEFLEEFGGNTTLEEVVIELEAIRETIEKELRVSQEDIDEAIEKATEVFDAAEETFNPLFEGGGGGIPSPVEDLKFAMDALADIILALDLSFEEAKLLAASREFQGEKLTLTEGEFADIIKDTSTPSTIEINADVTIIFEDSVSIDEEAIAEAVEEAIIEKVPEKLLKVS